MIIRWFIGVLTSLRYFLDCERLRATFLSLRVRVRQVRVCFLTVGTMWVRSVRVCWTRKWIIWHFYARGWSIRWKRTRNKRFWYFFFTFNYYLLFTFEITRSITLGELNKKHFLNQNSMFCFKKPLVQCIRKWSKSWIDIDTLIRFDSQSHTNRFDSIQYYILNFWNFRIDRIESNTFSESMLSMHYL